MTNDTENALAIYEPPAREMTRLKAAFSKDLATPDAIKEFATICRYYDLDPFIGEIVPMHGRIYVEEAGWLRHIQQKAPGQLVEYNAGICDKDEREAMDVKEGNWLAWGKVVRRYPNGALFPVRELATVTKDEVAGGGGYAPVTKEPWRMAMKRARVRALRIAFREVLHADAVEIGEAPIEVEALAEAEPLPFEPAGALESPAPPATATDVPTSDAAPVSPTAPTPEPAATGSTGGQANGKAGKLTEAKLKEYMEVVGVSVFQLCDFLNCQPTGVLQNVEVWVRLESGRTVKGCLEAAKAKAEGAS